VIGDELTGYTLSHQRFRSFISSHMNDEIDVYKVALMIYCSDWLKNQSRYALRYYASHLAEAGEWDTLHRLMALGSDQQLFSQARYSIEGSYAGFLRDLELLESHAKSIRQHNSQAIGQGVRYTLIASSLRSQSGTSPKILYWRIFARVTMKQAMVRKAM
jgi:hypothetical protein